MELLVVSQNVCRGCKELHLYLENEYEDVDGIVYGNIDEDPELIEKYGISSTPTTILLDGGEEVTRVSGFQAGVTDDIDVLVDQLD